MHVPTFHCTVFPCFSISIAQCERVRHWTIFEASCTEVKGSVGGSVFKADVHIPFQDVRIDINKITRRGGGEANLITETIYNIVCFSEDDWPTQALSSKLK